MLDYINKVRANPKDFIPYLKYLMKTADTSNKYKNHIVIDNQKVYLIEGIESIRKAISRLESSSSLLPLTHNEDLKISIPLTGSWCEPNYLIQTMTKHKRAIGRNVYLNIDISSFSPLNCILLQLIDDNGMKGQRFANIMSKKIKSCSISAIHSSLIKELISSDKDCYALYCVFS